MCGNVQARESGDGNGYAYLRLIIWDLLHALLRRRAKQDQVCLPRWGTGGSWGSPRA